jgi:hypothetical protein
MESMMVDKKLPQGPLKEAEPTVTKLVSGTDVTTDAEGEIIISMGWVDRPELGERHIVGRFVASREVAEVYCRQLMEALGIKEAKMPGMDD